MKNLFHTAPIFAIVVIFILQIPVVYSQTEACLYYQSTDTGFMLADIDGQNPVSFLPEATAIYWSGEQHFTFSTFQDMTTNLYLSENPGGIATNIGQFPPILRAEWSSDNEWFAFATFQGTMGQVWLLHTETSFAELIFETEDLVQGISWSPNSELLAISSGSTVLLVNTDREIEQEISFESESQLVYASWGYEEDSLVIEPGKGVIIIDLETQERRHFLPDSDLTVADWLSETEIFIQVLNSTLDIWEVVVLDINTGKVSQPLPSGDTIYDAVVSHNRAFVAMITGLFSTEDLLNVNIIILDVASGDFRQLTTFDDELLAYYDGSYVLEFDGTWSLDDSKFVFSTWDGFNNQIYQLDIETSNLLQITDNDTSWSNPTIRPCPQTH